MVGNLVERSRLKSTAVIALTAIWIWGSSLTSSPARAEEVTVDQATLAARRTAELSRQIAHALRADTVMDEATIQQLREFGPEALEYLKSRPELRQSPRWAVVLDAVAQQQDANSSGLYWYTDIEQAIAAARRGKKPIVSLRLLGKLTEELSCANSRFFRTALYPNPKVRSILADQFILHWQSVRDVPVITIDFGDGRQIRRTITGNSLHMILDEHGRTIDVLPGLYSAPEFIRQLQKSGPTALQMAELPGNDFVVRRTEYHQLRLNAVQQSWNELCQKAAIDSPLPEKLEQPEGFWARIATVAMTEPVLADVAQQQVAQRAAPAEAAGLRALTKSVVEMPMLKLVNNVARIFNEDSVRNEYYLHVRIHQWFAAGQSIPERDPLVRRIYEELFLSPLDDPWFGLSRPDVYSAIQNDGRIQVVTENTDH